MKNIKDTLRKNAKIIRKSIDTELCSSQICKKIEIWQEYKESHNIMLFYPVNTEISLLQLLNDNNKNFYFPVVEDNRIYPVLYNKKSGFKSGMFNIMEPVGEELTDYNVIDLIFVPALAVDTEGFRLGYGKGYYDRFLAHIPDSCKKVIPISSKLIFEKLPKESHDKSADYIISENGAVCTNARLSDD